MVFDHIIPKQLYHHVHDLVIRTSMKIAHLVSLLMTTQIASWFFFHFGSQLQNHMLYYPTSTLECKVAATFSLAFDVRISPTNKSNTLR